MDRTEEPATVAHVARIRRHGGDITVEISEWRGQCRCRLTQHHRDGGVRCVATLDPLRLDELLAALTTARQQL
jgi:hypothetical protein